MLEMIIGKRKGGGGNTNVANDTFDPSNILRYTLSNNNLTATFPSSFSTDYGYSRTLNSYSTGKVYFEYLSVSAASLYLMPIGIIASSSSLNQISGTPGIPTATAFMYAENYNGYIYINGTRLTSFSPPNTIVGGYYGVSVDFSSNTVGFYYNGTVVTTSTLVYTGTFKPPFYAAIFNSYSGRNTYGTVTMQQAPHYLPSGFTTW